MKGQYQKKIKLGVEQRHTKWAPFWAVIRKVGLGRSRRTHPSAITVGRRHWRQVKLKIKPRRTPNKHLG